MFQTWRNLLVSGHLIKMSHSFLIAKVHLTYVCVLRRYLCFIAGLILPIVHRAAAGSSAAAYSSTLGHATANLAFESAEDMSSTTLLLLLMPLVVPLTWIRSFSGLSNVSVNIGRSAFV